MKLKKENLMPAIVLSSICIVVALLLSLVNLITGPIIEKAQNEAANEALIEVLPGITTAEEVAVDESYPAAITKVYKTDVGYVFQASVTGKSSGLIIMCGVNNEGKVTGTKVIAEQETDSYDANVFPKVEGTNGVYTGMSLTDFEPYLVSGATLTSRAYSEAIKASLQAFVIAGGGDVDLRSPEQILQDNCNAALGTTDIEFTKWFKTEVISGVDGVYVSLEGNVYAIGEEFVGIKDGMVITADASEEAKALALVADNAVTSSALTDVTKPDGTDKLVTSIKVTATGNYVFELIGHGYKYESNYEFVGIEEGEIQIKLSISSDGKIIDVVTVYQEESKGFGDVCATEEYYEQYRGHGNDEIVITAPKPDFHADQIADGCTDIGAIASSTFTSTAYQSAVKAAFAAFEKLTNGGN